MVWRRRCNSSRMTIVPSVTGKMERQGIHQTASTASYAFVYDSSVAVWIADPKTAAGGAAGSTQVTVSNYSTTVSVSGYVAPSTIVTVSGYVAPSTTVTVSGYVAPSTQVTVANFSTVVTVSGYVAPSTTVSVTGYVAPSTDARVSPLAGSTWTTRPLQSSAADLQMTATPAAGSTFNVRALCSSAGDFMNKSWNLDSTGGGLIGSTKALNLGANGLVVRQGDVNSTTVSLRCTSTGNFTAISSAVTSIYVYGYQVCIINGLHGSTTVGGSTIGIVTNGAGGAQLWSWMISTVANITNNAVTPPGYLFKTAAGVALTWNQGAASSGADLCFSFWRE